MTIPSRSQAHTMLAEAEALNPGPWVQHSLVAARAAAAIAQRHPNLDSEQAYVLGALHDIGRREGVTDMHHIIAGYRYLDEMGYREAGGVCLTHSFPIKQVSAAAGRWDCTLDEKREVAAFLENVEYTLYDRLIQLCDALSLPSGTCLIEKRLVDVVRRYGFNDWTLKKWEATFAIQGVIEAGIGDSIYALLPDVVENTFGFAR